MVYRCCHLILVCVDGLASYVTAFLKAFRQPIRTGRRGRPRLVLPDGFQFAQAVKHSARRHVIGVTRRVVRGTPDGIEAVLEQARDAAGGKDIRLGGGVSTIRQYLEAGLVDEMHLAISPVLLGAGEHLLTGMDLPSLGYQLTEHATTPDAMHVVVTKR